MKKLYVWVVFLFISSMVYATDITYTDKSTGDTVSAADMNEIKAATNSKQDETGSAQLDAVFNTYASAQTLTAVTHKASVVQMTVAGEVTMWDCETANVGQSVTLWARDAEQIEVVPASGDNFVLFNGTALAANNELDMDDTAGAKMVLLCTADDTWSVYTESGLSTDGGAAD